jgi:protein SCO1/2
LLFRCWPAAARRRGGARRSEHRLTGASFAKDFALTDHTGKPRTMADFKGKVVVMFFGYTQCPDVCPTTMAE